MESPRSLTQPALIAPPPPSFNSMPNVVVTPPEEEHDETPPWVYFDASKAGNKSTTPDLESLDIALDVHQQITNTAPVFQRGNISQETVVMPKRHGILTFTPPKNWQPVNIRESDNDDDVVEVIKVRRHEGFSQSSGETKVATLSRSKTFKARAAQAFRSLKNVGKSNRKSSVQDIWAPKDAHAEKLPASSTRRNISKGKPRPLSQVFEPGHEEARPMSPSETASPPQSPTSPRNYALPLSRPQSPLEMNEAPLSLSPELIEPRASSPVPHPSAKRTKSFRKRLSNLELPRLFSSSSTKSTASASSSEASTASPPTPSSEVPEIVPLPSSSSGRRSSDRWILSNLDHPEDLEDDDELEDYGEIRPLSMVREEDISGELRLDSFQFDSMSFDANDFTMTSVKRRNTSQLTL